MSTDHTTGGSVSWRTIMNPMQMRMRDKFVRTMRQQTPLVLGQKGLGADMVSTASPAFVVFLDLTVLIPLAVVMFVRTLFPLQGGTSWSNIAPVTSIIITVLTLTHRYIYGFNLFLHYLLDYDNDVKCGGERW